MKIVSLLIGLLPELILAEKTQLFKGFFVNAFLDPTDSSYAIFEIDMPTGTWFGLGLGTKNMSKNSDMLMFDASSQKVFDMHAVGNRLPIKDDSQDLQFTFK